MKAERVHSAVHQFHRKRAKLSPRCGIIERFPDRRPKYLKAIFKGGKRGEDAPINITIFNRCAGVLSSEATINKTHGVRM